MVRISKAAICPFKQKNEKTVNTVAVKANMDLSLIIDRMNTDKTKAIPGRSMMG